MSKKLFNGEQRLDVANLLNSIGLVYDLLNEHEKSLEFFIKVYDMRRKLESYFFNCFYSY
jgi:hypothetical protein